MVRVAITEDDPQCAAQLRRFITDFGRDTGERFTITCYDSGEELLRDYRPVFDVIFMDIEMRKLNGIDTARKLREVDCRTILVFVTRMAQYAVKGYEVDALDFIVKPVDYRSFEFRLLRVLERLRVRKDLSVVIRDNGIFRVLNSSEIFYVEVLNHNLIYHTKEGDIRVRGSLSDAEKQLYPAGFRQCSKSFLVNMACVTAIEGNSITVGNSSIPLSRSMRRNIINALADYYGGTL